MTTLKTLMNTFAQEGGVMLPPERLEQRIFLDAGMLAGGFRRVVPCLVSQRLVITERSGHRFVVEPFRTATRPAPQGWVRHQDSILLIPA